MKIKLFTIPNLITLSNLLCGAGSIVVSLVYEDLTMAFVLIMAAAVCDFFDGFAARVLKQPSEIGVQLDSLADMVSFGTAPAAAFYTLCGYFPSAVDDIWVGRLTEVMRFIPFIITAFSHCGSPSSISTKRSTRSSAGLRRPPMPFSAARSR